MTLFNANVCFGEAEIRQKCEIMLQVTERLEAEAATARREIETLYEQIIFLERKIEQCKHQQQHRRVQKRKKEKRRLPVKKKKTDIGTVAETKDEEKELLKKFGPVYANRYLALKTSLNL